MYNKNKNNRRVDMFGVRIRAQQQRAHTQIFYSILLLNTLFDSSVPLFFPCNMSVEAATL